MEEIRKNVLEPFYECEKCGYQKGFHVMMQPIEFGDRISVRLICPDCGQRYDIGWTIQLET